MPAYDKPVRIHCKTGSLSAKLVFEIRAKCQDFVARCKDDGIPTKLIVHPGKEEPISQSVSVSHYKTRKFWKQFAPLWKVWAWKLEVLFPEGDDTGTFIVPALDVCAQVLSIKKRRNCVGSQVFKLVSCGNGQLFALTAPDLRIPVFQIECCNRSSLKSERPMCDGRPFASPLFRRLAGRGTFFRGFPFRWALQLTVSLARCLTYTMSCLFFAALWLHRSESVLFVAGDSASQGYQFDLLQDAADQVRHMLTSGPISLEWPTALLARSDQSSPSFSHEDLLDEQRGDALLAPLHLRWRSDALQQPQVQQGGVDWNTCVHIPDSGLRCVTWNARGLIGSVSSSQISRELKLKSGCMVRWYKATRMQEDQPYAFTKTYCLTMLLLKNV